MTTETVTTEMRSPTCGQLMAALARARVRFAPLTKGRKVKVTSRKTGATFTYAYADLASILEAVTPALSEEKIALLTPSRVADGFVVTRTELWHESGEWIASEFACPIIDSGDPQSYGSALTFARRYGVSSLLCLAADEDDDAQVARGGDHEMAKVAEPTKGEVACPACGVIGALIKGSPQYGGGWLCWAKKGGCGAKWASEVPPTAPPEADLMPREKAVSPGVGRSSSGASSVASAEPSGDIPPGRVRFVFNRTEYETAGLTAEQFRESIALTVQADKAHGKGFSRAQLAGILGVPVEKADRRQATEEQGEAWLNLLRDAVR